MSYLSIVAHEDMGLKDMLLIWARYTLDCESKSVYAKHMYALPQGEAVSKAAQR